MKRFRRVIALLVLAATILTSIPTGVLADAAEGQEATTTKEYLSDNLKESKAEKAETKSEKYWEEEAPQDAEEAAELYVKDAQRVEAEGSGADKHSVPLEDVDVSTAEKRFDKNGLRETTHTVRVTYTVANKAYLKAKTIDDLFDKNVDAFLTSVVSTSPVYESKKYEDCYVAFLNYGGMNHLSNKIIDADFVTNVQASPKDVSGDIVFDKKTGIVYIPKSYYFATDGTELGYDLQAQILVALHIGTGVEIHVTAENHSSARTMFKSERQAFSAFNNLTVGLITPETADKVDFHDIDVYLNDGALPLKLKEGEDAFYDKETGEYTLNCMTTTVYAVRFEIKNRLLSKAFDAVTGGQKVYASQTGTNITYVTNVTTKVPIAPSIEYDKIQEGDTYNYDGTNSTHNDELMRSMLNNGQKNFIYAPSLPNSGTDSVRDAFYDAVTSKAGDTAKKLENIKDLVTPANQNAAAGSAGGTANRNKEKFYWYMFGIGAPSGVLTEVHNKTTASFGSLSEWNWSDTYTYNGGTQYRHMYVGMCCHVGKAMVGGSKKNQVSVLEKGAGYVVLGLAQTSKGTSKDDQAGATIIKVAVADYGQVTRSAQKSGTQEVSFQLSKTDLDTSVGLAGAEFTFFCDGSKTGTAVSDKDGKVSYKYTRTVKTENYTSTKVYVKNWSSLPASVQTRETANGRYSDPTAATIAAQNEVDAKAKAAYTSLFNANHTWTVSETKPPFGHSKAPQSERTVLETINEKTFSLDYSNPAEYRDVNMVKKSSHEDMGAEATLKDAVYGLYAKENILFTDNRTVVYHPDELVATLRTDEKGEAGIEGLHPGVYYLKELEAPVGFEKDPNTYTLNMNEGDAGITLTDQLIRGRIQVQKTYGKGDPEAGAEFEIYNIKEELAAVLTTDETGKAISGYLPYGTYTVRQTKGTEGYMLLPDHMINIHQQQIYQIKENNDELYAGIAITKTTKVEDWETGYMEKKPEAGAEFEITRNGRLIETLVCNGSGVAISGKLEPGCTYHVEQTKGDGNFAFIEPFDVVFKENEYVIKRYSFEDYFDGKKVKIEKLMSNEAGTSPEYKAEFYILDAALANHIQNADLSTAEKRLSYCSTLPEEAIVTTLLTDKNGSDIKILVNLPKGHDFIALQVRGEPGYSLAAPYYSAAHKPREEGKIDAYVIEAEDVLEDWGKIEISKTMATDRVNGGVQTRPEKGAEFEIYNSGGKVIDRIVTDSNGNGLSKQLPFGVYMVHQSKGADSHQKIDDFRVVINKDNKQKTVTYQLRNEEKPVNFTLIKRSTETGKLLGGATYEIYNEGGNRVASITTDKDGKASYQLPFGRYTAKEVKAPDGYKLGKDFSFELSYKTLKYRDGGTAYYVVEAYNAPVYAEIKLTKTGDAFEGVRGNQAWYEKGPVPGAEYTLYAREAIVKDDGTELYPAGAEIDTKTTDKKGSIQFSWKGLKGVDPTLFPMGSYYIKETKVPYGYTLDPAEYDVILTWDQKASELNKEVEPETDEGFAGTLEKSEPNTGKYILKSVYPDTIYPWQSVTGDIIFTDAKAPNGAVLTDVSSLNDGSVVLWMSGNDAYISTQTETQDVIFNRNSEGLFQNAQAKNIYFDCVDTSQAEVMTGLFENCDNLTVLDLRNFSTRQVRFVDRMFYSCDNLTTVYTVSAELEGVTPDTVRMEGILVKPKYEFLTGASYSVDDFEFYGKYSDGMKQRIYVSADEVTIHPQKAGKAGKETVTFTFGAGSSYSGLGTAEAEAEVIEMPELQDKPLEDYEWKTDLTDDLQKHTILFSKVDTKGAPVEGAEFTLYAACDIVNKDGKTIFSTGKPIMTATSALQGGEAVVEFRDLPSDMYKKNPSEPGSMFTVKETKPAPGYQKTTVQMDFAMDLKNAGNNASIVHTAPDDGDTAPYYTVGTTTLYDAQDVVNKETPYVTLIKTWDDKNGTIGNRPDSVTVTVKMKDGTEKKYTIKASDGWSLTTDIPKDDFGEIDKVIEEKLKDYYSKAHKDLNGQYLEVINRPKVEKINLAVKKVWKDEDNQDGIRPASVIVDLYQNGKVVNTKTLYAGNNWYLEVRDLEAKDENGAPYHYEFRERESDVLTGDPTTGYEAGYSIAAPDAANEYPYQTTYITNTHVPKETEFQVEKVWEDGNDQDGLRTNSITATLRGRTSAAGTVMEKQVTLSAANGWKGKVTGLPVYHGGVKIQYTWTEEPWANLTGNAETGYKVSYQNQTADPAKPCVIQNQHTPKRGVIKIRKAVKAGEVIKDLKFTFEIKGGLKDGTTYQDAKTVAFTKEEAEKAAQGETLYKEVVFDDLAPGAYSVTEGGMEEYYRLESISSGGAGIVVRDSKGTIRKDTSRTPSVYAP